MLRSVARRCSLLLGIRVRVGLSEGVSDLFVPGVW